MSINKILLDGVIADNVVVVRCALERGADSNYYEDSQKITPMHFAVQYGCARVIPLLMCAGADIFVCNADGESPFDQAVSIGNSEIINILFYHMNLRFIFSITNFLSNIQDKKNIH